MVDFNKRSRSQAKIEPLAMFPPSNGEVVNVAFTDHLINNTGGCTRIWIGTGGDLTVRLRNADQDATYTNIPDGSEFVGNVIVVRKTGTTCSDMIADWPEEF